jgi:hypothetical protein
MSKKSEVFYDLQKHVSKGFDGIIVDKTIIKSRKTPVVNYDELEEQLNRSIQYTSDQISFGDTFQSLFVWGPTGVGKTEIIKKIAEKHGAIYHKIEIQKVPIEELQGFPYLHKSTDGKTVVRLAHPTDLPPSDSEDLWVFHLDEFNKADTEDMAAVMNLVLNGEIGGSADFNEETGESEKYRLPKRTVVIGSGNSKEQKNTSSFNSVSNLDIATAERWHRNLYIEYDALSWLKNYAQKEFIWKGETLSTRIPSIISFYIMDKYIENDENDAPFIIPKSISKGSDEVESTMSPRAWTLASNEVIADMYSDWKSLDKKEKLRYNDNFDDFYLDPNNQIKHLLGNVYEFGADGQDLVGDIITRYVYFSENRVLPEDVIYSYKDYRSKIKKLAEKKGAIMYLLYGVGHAIKYIEEFDDIKIPAINISTFITDTDILAEDLSVFIYELNQIGSELAKELNDLMYSINPRYKAAYQGYYHTGIAELDDVV